MKATIKNIQQKDNTTFTIEWTDGAIIDYPLSQLQKKCPCAGCQNNPSSYLAKVRTMKIRSVGRYAIKIDFTDGCSSGIYDFDLLRNFNEKNS